MVKVGNTVTYLLLMVKYERFKFIAKVLHLSHTVQVYLKHEVCLKHVKNSVHTS